MVKVGGKWVTPEEQEVLVGKAGDIIREAYDLMKANKLKEAEPLLKQALDLDPQNPVANYLNGVLLFRADKFVPARKAFEATRAQIPSDAAAINNIAVIAWRQNQFLNSIGFYCDAMLAMPANKEILSNVAEALYGLKDELRKTPAAQKTSRLFVEQEAELEKVMAQYGWYRWGSMWLDQAQLNELKKSEKEVKDKMDAMQAQFDQLTAERRNNESNILRQRQIMTDIDQANTYIDPKTGIGYRNTFKPQSYYDAANEANRLASLNDTINANLAQMRESGKRLEATKPKPKYTGIQKLIGVEGTPKIGVLAVEMAPATAPTTEPSNLAPQAAPIPALPPVEVPSSQPTTPAPAPPVRSPASAPTTHNVY